MHLQVPVSRTLQKKLAALSQLEDIDDFETFVATQIECIVEDRISHFMSVTSPRRPQRQRIVPVAGPVRNDSAVTIPTRGCESVMVEAPSPEAELSHESYFDEDDEPALQEPAASVGGLTLEQIENDDKVDDPDHEAVGSPGDYSFEDMAAAAHAKATQQEPQASFDLDAQLQKLADDAVPDDAYIAPPLPSNSAVKVPRSVVRKPPKVKAKVSEMTEIAE